MAVPDAWKEFPGLVTDRLRLRQLDPESDAAAYYEGISTVGLEIWTSREKGSLEKTRQHLKFENAAYRRKSVLAWGITLKDSGKVIGYVRLSEFENQTRAEIAYWLHAEHRRQGLMSEALRVVIPCGFESLGLHRIQAYVRADNPASQRLLLALGFQQEGLLRKYQLRADGWADMFIFSLLAGE